jgi:hypothetical protein
MQAPLANLATRIYTALANSVPSERSFSTLNFLHSQRRNRLASDLADMSAFVYMNSRVLARLGHKESVEAQAVQWEDVNEEALIEIEDIAQEALELAGNNEASDVEEGHEAEDVQPAGQLATLAFASQLSQLASNTTPMVKLQAYESGDGFLYSPALETQSQVIQ